MNTESVRSNIWKYFIVTALSSAWFIMPISILYLQSFNLTFLEIGIIYGISTLVVVIFIIPAGAITDLIGKKWSSFIGTLLWSFGLFLIGIGDNFYIFLLGYIFFYGLSEVMLTSAFSAILYDTLLKINAEKMYVKISQRLLLITSILIIVGSLSGVFLYNINKRLPFLLFSALILISSVFIIFMKEPFKNQRKFTLKNHYRQMRAGLKNSVKNKRIRFLLVCSILLSIPTSLFLTLLEQPYLMSLGFTIGTIGLIVALTRGLIGIMSSLIGILEKRLGQGNSFYLIIIVYSIVFVLIGLFNSPLMVIFLFCLIFTVEYKNILLMKYLNQNVDIHQRSTVFSIQSFYVNLFYSITIFFASICLTLVSINTFLVFMGLSTFVIAMPYLVSNQRHS